MKFSPSSLRFFSKAGVSTAPRMKLPVSAKTIHSFSSSTWSQENGNTESLTRGDGIDSNPSLCKIRRPSASEGDQRVF